MPSLAENELAYYQTQTNLPGESYARVERAYWLQQLGLPESALLSLSDAKLRALQSLVPEYSNMSIADLEYRYWWKRFGFNPDSPPYGLSTSDLENLVYGINAIATSSVLTFDTRLENNSGGRLVNRGSLGVAGDAWAGNVKRSIIMPDHVYLPGVAQNFMSTPDQAALKITGDIELEAWAALDTWTPSAVNYTLISKWNPTGNQRSYAVTQQPAGTIQFALSNLGTVTTAVSSSVVVPFTAGQLGGIRCTWRQSDGRVQFFTATNFQSPVWTQLGTNQTIAIASIFPSTAIAAVGVQSDGATGPSAGKFYDGKIRNGIGGTLVANFRASDQAVNMDIMTATAPTGEVWTINRVTTTNDPQWLRFAGEKYIYTPGIGGNDIRTVAGNLAYDIPGDYEIVARVALTDWTPAAINYIYYRVIGAQNQVTFSITTSGSILLRWYPDGTAGSVKTATSTVPVPVVDGQTAWIKVTQKVDNGAAGSTTTFYWAPDRSTEPTSWNQLGTPVTTAGVTPLFPLGLQNTYWSVLAEMKFFEGILRSGIGGTEIVHVKASNANQTGLTGSLGETWVIERAATPARKSVVVERNCYMFGVDDYFEIPDNAQLNFNATDSFTIALSLRMWPWESLGTPIAKKPDSTVSAGWDLYTAVTFSPRSALADGTLAQGKNVLVSNVNGLLDVFGLTCGPQTTGNQKFFAAGVEISGTGTRTPGDSTNALPVRIGRFSAATTTYSDMEFLGALVNRKFSSNDDIANLYAVMK